MIRVLIVDDHPMFRAGAASAMAEEPDFEVVGEAQDANEALALIQTSQPDVLLLDIRLKGGVSGIALAQQVRSEYPQIKIMVLTNYSYEPYIQAMIEIGVEGYILKDVPPHEVIEAVRMIMDGRTVFSDVVTKKIRQSYLERASGSSYAASERITEREYKVLQLLADGMSNSEIAESLNFSLTTVQFHLSNIYGKLGVRTRSEAVVHAARQGLVVIDE